MKEVYLYTDGACSGNPGPGGYGAILVYKGHEKVMSAGYRTTTNNRMELMGVIVGLSALNEPCKVQLYTDSKYVSEAIEKGWAISWQQNGWRKKDKKPAKNPDLWEELLMLLDKHDVVIHWLKGHAGHEFNERCDKLAVAAYLSDDLLEDANYME
ncbi:MAG: ribonuclease HI [Clostridia bacterium]|nr:ribonuclease HI [Clostridia bacterium]